MKKIIYILIIFSLYGCGLQRRTYCERKANKVARILKDCPNIIDTTVIHDTTIICDTVRITIPAKVDSNVVDSLLKEYCDALLAEKATGKTDTHIVKIREKIYLQCSPEKVIGSGERLLVSGKDTVAISFKGTKTGIEFQIISVKKQIETIRTLVVPCPSCDLTLWQDIKQNGFKWLLIFLAGVATSFILVFFVKVLL